MRFAQLPSAAASFLRRTDVDTIRASAVLRPETAHLWTVNANMANTTLYALNALNPFTAIANGVVALGKGAVAATLVLGALGDKGQTQAGRLSLAGDLARSALENLVVGALACIPVVGSWVAGAMALRSLGDAWVAEETSVPTPVTTAVKAKVPSAAEGA